MALLISLLWVSLKAELFLFFSAAQTHHFHHLLQLLHGCLNHGWAWQYKGKPEHDENALLNHPHLSPPGLLCLAAAAVCRVSVLDHLIINQKETDGVQGHGDSEHPFTLRPVTLCSTGSTKNELLLLHLYPILCSKPPSKWSLLTWEKVGEGRQRLLPQRPLCC